jgi:uncharacterized protein YjiS (DUF1127 family)
MRKHVWNWQFLDTVRQAYWRQRARRQLLGLSEQMLADIGLTRGEARWEGGKPFWRQ